ncbi:unnamed protein product [Scytosiphon promiscuus]
MADHMITTYREKAEMWIQQVMLTLSVLYVGFANEQLVIPTAVLPLAGQCFRVSKRFQDAGAAYKQCGRLEERLNNPDVAASLYHEAALCFQKDDPQEAATCYLSAINLFCQRQRFSTAARLECEVAELMQNDRNRRMAIVHYIKAADFYRANTCFDEATDHCLLKANALGLGESYMEASALFQEVGRRMLVNDLLKFNTPDTFLKAVLCLQCASGMIQPVPEGHHRKPGAATSSPQPTINSVKATIVSLGKACSVFQGSRAYMFASDIALAEKEGDLHLFAARLYAYNNVCRLNAWYLRRVLETIRDHVQTKATKLRKMRAVQAIRRKQRAEERARDRIKRRQDLSKQDDSSEEALSETNDSSSSEAILPSSNKSNTETRSSSSSPRSDSDMSPDSDSSSSDSESSSGTVTSSSSGPSSSEGDSGTSGGGKSTRSVRSGASECSNTTGSAGEKRARGPAGRDSPTFTESSSASMKSDSFSEYSNSSTVGGSIPEKAKKTGALKFENDQPSSGSNSSRSFSARWTGSDSATYEEDGEGKLRSGSPEPSGGLKQRAGKKQTGNGRNISERNENKKNSKAKLRFWKRK